MADRSVLTSDTLEVLRTTYNSTAADVGDIADLGNPFGGSPSDLIEAVNSKAHYTGQSDIVTVGTISTGTWQGTVVADAYVADDLTIDGGVIDNTIIGGSTPANGNFTTVDANIEYLFTGRADHNFTPAAGRGILWVDNVGDGRLIFTDGNSVDHDLITAAGGNVSNVNTPVNNQLAVWTGVDTIEGDPNLTFDGVSQVLDINGTVDASIEYLFTAQANHTFGPTAGRGILWLENSGDGILRFTDGAGVDHDILGGGDVLISGTPVANEVAVWTSADTIQGDANFTWSGTVLNVTGDLTVDTNTLHVDSTNNRVGVGLTNPAYTFDVSGTVAGDDFVSDLSFYNNNNSISSYTIASNYNAITAGPVTVTGTVTVPSGSSWIVL